MNRFPGLLAVLLSMVMLQAGCALQPDKDAEKKQAIAEVNVKLALQYYQNGRLEQALSNAQRAHKARENYPPALVALALIFQALERDEEAEQFYQASVKSVDSNSGFYGMVYNNFGVHLCSQEGKADEAVDYFIKAAEHPLYDTPAAALENAGTCALRSGQQQKAKTLFERVLALNPRQANSLLLMSRMSFEQKQYLNARAYIERYFAQEPGDAEVLALAIKIERAMGDDKTAGEYLKLLNQRFPRSQQARALNP